MEDQKNYQVKISGQFENNKNNSEMFKKVVGNEPWVYGYDIDESFLDDTVDGCSGKLFTVDDTQRAVIQRKIK